MKNLILTIASFLVAHAAFACSASFTSSISVNTASFYNNSTGPTAGVASIQAAWDFGDGTTGTGLNATHTYSYGSTYIIGYKITWRDASNNVICTDSTSSYITIGSSTPNCATSHALFTSSVSGYAASFTNTSTYSSWSAATTALWYFGDGGTSPLISPTHTYASTGTYNVFLVMSWYDSLNSTTCTDTISHNITISGGTTVNQITGALVIDSSASANPISPNFKVWLIKYDATTADLSAVDSVTVSGSSYSGYYVFSNKPAGAYRVKAMITNGPTSGTAAIPTYGLDSLYWHGANVINYSGTGVNGGNHIWLQNGTVTSGPGFIAGNVTSGANRGTQTTGLAVANLVIFLQNASGKAIAYTTTDGSGNYHFANFPTGNYKIYPESAGYATTAYAVTVGTTQLNNINFTKHTLSKTITPSNVSVPTVTAASSTFGLFPNPTSGIVNISWSSKTELQDAHAVVTDIAGRRVFETPLNMNASSGTVQLNLSSLKAGMYFISISAGGVNYTNKIVLQH